MPTYTTEEKIDYIFRELKAQKRTRILKVLLRISILWFMIFLYFEYIHSIDKEIIINNVSEIIWDIVKPIAENMVNDMLNNTNSIGTQNLQESLLEEIKNNPNIINNIK